MTIALGALTKRFGITPRAARYYEGKGLLHPTRIMSSSGKNNKRVYSEADIVQVQAILTLKNCRYTIEEIRKLIPEFIKSDSLLPLDEINKQIGFLEAERTKIDISLETLRAMKVRYNGATDHVEG